jgi:hypothetical protein
MISVVILVEGQLEYLLVFVESVNAPSSGGSLILLCTGRLPRIYVTQVMLDMGNVCVPDLWQSVSVKGHPTLAGTY